MRPNVALEDALVDQWALALAHAGLDPTQARLWCGRGPHDPEAGANYYLPVREIEDRHGLDDDQFAEAHTDENRALHRVVVYPDYPPSGDEDIPDGLLLAIFGALLRHELEHARQFEACGYDLFDLDDAVVMPVLSQQAGGLPGSAGLYNLKPLEQDANGAAAMFLLEHHDEAVEDILHGPCAQLARSLIGPGDPTTLPARTICFLFLFREACERATEGSFSFSSWISTYSRELATLWSALEAA